MKPEHQSSTRFAPLDLSHHFSEVTKDRQASDVKRFYKYFMIPGMHNLAGGLPHFSYFPYDTLEASAAHSNRFEPTSISPVDPEPPKPNRSPAALHLKVPKESNTTNILSKIDLQTALQYGTADGFPPLHSFVRQFVRDHLHPNVPYSKGPEVILTCGSTDGFSKTIEAFTNAWVEHKDNVRDREGIVCEEFAYMSAIQTVKPRGLNIVPVAIDSYGMKPFGKGGLADILENWDLSRGKRPHLMYTVTLGQNPTGTTMPVERRREIYALCQTYDIIIIEDEPYWNLQYPSASQATVKYRGDHKSTLFNRNYNEHGRSSGYEFLDSLVPSYLSIDVDGRVVRVDTFSKTIAPGCRLGWLTAQPAIVERIARITEVTTQQPSGFVQAMVAELLIGQQSSAARSAARKDRKGDEGWEMDGWVRWLEGLRGAYERRMQNMCRILDEGKFVAMDSVLGQQPNQDSWSMVSKVPMYEFDWPMAGMFIWIKIRYDTHPLLAKYGAEKVCTSLWTFLTTKPFLCLVAPGTMFAPTDAVREYAFQYLRLCFAPMPEDAVVDYAQHFAAGCRAFWQLPNFDDIPDLDEDTRMYMHSVQGLHMC